MENKSAFQQVKYILTSEGEEKNYLMSSIIKYYNTVKYREKETRGEVIKFPKMVKEE